MGNKFTLNGFKWHPCDYKMAQTLTDCTENPGVAYSITDFSVLPAGIQQMPGLSEVYLSGCCLPETISSGQLSAYGEFAIIREDRDQKKSYNYVFTKNEDGEFYYTGIVKGFNAHHFPASASTPISGIFGVADYDKLKSGK